ncbi:MAG: hypothetical protein JJ877_00420 [Thalassococcus sp.]|uniref:hypothetical protein n=1 Tax=Thalassococcus sp. TaxID=1928858 RepID=UPI001B1B4091|nr:hypothetical protein [Thalassococcus sp.]MBO6865477.1 hypothetical protein [Thalassococcus sp.]
MSAAAPIEDFLEAITAQLDKTQDNLRLKAVNRPLTFALKDFSIDLSVFVEMDRDGQVRLRPSGPNESGASVIKIGFTTITRPMIEENTISMEMTQSPSLEDAGFAPDESKQLQRLGVRNLAQLEKLRQRTDEDSVAQFAGLDSGVLRQRLQKARPRIDLVQIGRKETPLPAANGPRTPEVSLRSGQSKLRLRGRRLTEAGESPVAKLDGKTLPIRSFSQSHIDVELDGLTGGLLELELPGGTVEALSLMMEPDTDKDTPPTDSGAGWSDPDRDEVEDQS